MNDKPLVWHYGLMAERWAEFNHEAREVPYLLSKIKQYGQPVLDLVVERGESFYRCCSKAFTLMVVTSLKI